MYFIGSNTFSEPWHLPHTPPEQIKEIVYALFLSYVLCQSFLLKFMLVLYNIQLQQGRNERKGMKGPSPHWGWCWIFKIFIFITLVIFTGRYEGAFNTFVDEINAIASYQWWEGALHSILCVLAYPLAWSWQQWRQRMKLQRLREFVRSEYDHACLRSCRSRALYEGLKVISNWIIVWYYSYCCFSVVTFSFVQMFSGKSF